MTYKKRKLSFYRLTLEKHVFEQANNKTQIRTLSNEEMEGHFKKLYDTKMLELDNGRKAVNVKNPNGDYVLEIIEYNEHFVFAKVGQQNRANTVALRDKNTLESENVPMTETQLLELYTFCLIDFETGIISYIGINGAPRISAIKGLFDIFLQCEEGIHTKLAAIMTNDILQTLVKKNIISKISLTVAVPDDSLLSNIGLSAKDFDSLRNVKTRTATYKLVAIRNKNIFHSSGKLAELIVAIKTRFGDSLMNINVNAKDFNESSQTYDLLQYNFTKTVNLGGENHDTLLESDFKIALKDTYISNKEDLLRFI